MRDVATPRTGAAVLPHSVCSHRYSAMPARCPKEQSLASSKGCSSTAPLSTIMRWRRSAHMVPCEGMEVGPCEVRPITNGGWPLNGKEMRLLRRTHKTYSSSRKGSSQMGFDTKLAHAPLVFRVGDSPRPCMTLKDWRQHVICHGGLPAPFEFRRTRDRELSGAASGCESPKAGEGSQVQCGVGHPPSSFAKSKRIFRQRRYLVPSLTARRERPPL